MRTEDERTDRVKMVLLLTSVRKIPVVWWLCVARECGTIPLLLLLLLRRVVYLELGLFFRLFVVVSTTTTSK